MRLDQWAANGHNDLRRAGAGDAMLIRMMALAGVWAAFVVGARADELCPNLRAILKAAPTEFSGIRGAELDSPVPALKIYDGILLLTREASCAVAEQTNEGKRFSTSYTCSKVGPDTDAGIQSLTGQVRDCLDVQGWAVQPGPEGGGARSAKYGLIRLSITRNGQAGLALGVEAFRDAQGQVFGSPVRGDRAENDGSRRCTPKALETLERDLAGYGARPGAERFTQAEFTGFTNSVSSPIVAFMTRPPHPAHPALIVRDVEKRDAGAVITGKGDFAGDCEEFHKLLGQVRDMNDDAARQSRSK
jgi:hypothetical protein